MISSRLLLAATILAMSCAPALAQRAPAPYQDQETVPLPDPAETTNNKAVDRRLDRDEKALRELRGIVLKAQSQGSPVTVVPAGPDPIVTDLQARVGDLQTSLRDLTGQTEALRTDLDQARRDLAFVLGQVKALTDLAQQQASAAATAAAAASELSSSEAQAAPVDEGDSYRQARALIDGGDLVAGAAAMQDFTQRFPNSPRLATAYYWMGRSYAGRAQHAQAAAAFARSLKGWPQASWAGDAVVELAGSLTAMKRTPDACKALNEFDTRYAGKASAATKALAGQARTAAACG
jgi:TolA-binding protein